MVDGMVGSDDAHLCWGASRVLPCLGWSTNRRTTHLHP